MPKVDIRDKTTTGKAVNMRYHGIPLAPSRGFGDERTRNGITRTEVPEVDSVPRWEDDQVCLEIGRGQA